MCERWPSSEGGERDEGIGDESDGMVPPGARPPDRRWSGTVQSLPKRRPHKGGIPLGRGIKNGDIAVLCEESHDAGHGDEQGRTTPRLTGTVQSERSPFNPRASRLYPASRSRKFRRLLGAVKCMQVVGAEVDWIKDEAFDALAQHRVPLWLRVVDP
jgi:hypothetical protein